MVQRLPGRPRLRTSGTTRSLLPAVTIPYVPVMGIPFASSPPLAPRGLDYLESIARAGRLHNMLRFSHFLVAIIIADDTCHFPLRQFISQGKKSIGQVQNDRVTIPSSRLGSTSRASTESWCQCLRLPNSYPAAGPDLLMFLLVWWQ